MAPRCKGPKNVLRITNFFPGNPGQMSVGTCIILRMTETWTKYTYACDPDECDSLIEFTCKDDFGFPSGSVMNITCPCARKPTLLSVEPATIAPTNQTKEEKMEDTQLSPAVEYNPNLLVTYKILNGYSDPEYATSKVSTIEWDLHNSRSNAKIASSYATKVLNVRDIITEAYADSDDQDTLRSIAEALDISLTREVSWSATIEVSGTIEVDLLEDVDVEQAIYDNLYVDANQGDITIGDTEVCNVREAY